MMVYVSSVCVSAMRRASYCVHSWEAPPHFISSPLIRCQGKKFGAEWCAVESYSNRSMQSVTRVFVPSV